MYKDRIAEIYQTALARPDLNHLLSQNDFDLSWLKPKLEPEEYTKLEEVIFSYGNKNDEILFQVGFQYAWDLFLQCSK